MHAAIIYVVRVTRQNTLNQALEHAEKGASGQLGLNSLLCGQKASVEITASVSSKTTSILRQLLLRQDLGVGL